MAMEMIGDLFGLPYFIFASSSPAPERVALAIRAQICNLAAPTEPVGVHGTRIQILGAHFQSVRQSWCTALNHYKMTQMWKTSNK